MEVICIETEAFYLLLEKAVVRLEKKLIEKPRWIKLDEAMQILAVKSKSTMQKLRDNGEIVFSQPNKRIVLYDRGSLEAYLVKHSKERF